MTFTARGMLFGEAVTVEWSDGALSSTPPHAAEFLTRLAQWREGVPVGLVMGPWTTTQHLASPYSALALVEDMLTAVEVVGDIPPRPAIPDEVNA